MSTKNRPVRTRPMPKKAKDEGKFVLKSKTLFKDILNDEVQELPESDLCFQDNKGIYQFKFEKPEIDHKEIIKPGIFTLSEANNRLILKKSELRVRNLLTSIANTQ